MHSVHLSGRWHWSYLICQMCASLSEVCGDRSFLGFRQRNLGSDMHVLSTSSILRPHRPLCRHINISGTVQCIVSSDRLYCVVLPGLGIRSIVKAAPSSRLAPTPHQTKRSTRHDRHPRDYTTPIDSAVSCPDTRRVHQYRPRTTKAHCMCTQRGSVSADFHISYARSIATTIKLAAKA